MIAFEAECKRIRFRWDVPDADQDEVGSPFMCLRSDGLFVRSCALVERDVTLRLTVGGGLYICRGDHVVQSLDGREVAHAVPLLQTRAVRVPLVSRVLTTPSGSTMRPGANSAPPPAAQDAYQLQVREDLIQHAVVLVWTSAPSDHGNVMSSWSPDAPVALDALSIHKRLDSFERPVTSGSGSDAEADEPSRPALSASFVLNGSFLSRRSPSANTSGVFRVNSRSESSWPVGSIERAQILSERCLPVVFGTAESKSKFMRALTPLLKRELTQPADPQEDSARAAAPGTSALSGTGEPTPSALHERAPGLSDGTTPSAENPPIRNVVELSSSRSHDVPVDERPTGPDTPSLVEDTLIESSTAVAQRMIERLTAEHTVICSPFAVTNQAVENSRAIVAVVHDPEATVALLRANADPIPFFDVLKSRRPETTDAAGLEQFFDTCHQLYRKQHDEINRRVAELSVKRRVGLQLLSHITGPGVCDLFRGWALQRKRETNALQQYSLELQHLYWSLVEAEKDEQDLETGTVDSSSESNAHMPELRSGADVDTSSGDEASMPSWCTRTVASVVNPLTFYDASATTTRRLELCRRLHANITELLARQAKRQHLQRQAAEFPRAVGRRAGHRIRSNVLPDVVADQMNAVTS